MNLSFEFARYLRHHARLSHSFSHLAALAATGSLVLLSASGLAADASPPPVGPPMARLVRDPFDAPAAWAEFTELLRLNYAYLTRPGIDGEAILAYFELRAKAAASKEAFREVLQLVAHNFADPHFSVGPLARRGPHPLAPSPKKRGN